MSKCGETDASRLQAAEKGDMQQRAMYKGITETVKALNFWYSEAQHEGDEEQDEAVLKIFQGLTSFALALTSFFTLHSVFYNDLLFQLQQKVEQKTVSVVTLKNVHKFNVALFDLLQPFYMAQKARLSLFETTEVEFANLLGELKRTKD
jgi:hypothetical protein